MVFPNWRVHNHTSVSLRRSENEYGMCSQVELKPLSSSPEKWPDELRDAVLRADKNSDLAELTQSFSIKVLHLEDQKSDFTPPSQRCAPSLSRRGSLDEFHPPRGAPNKAFQTVPKWGRHCGNTSFLKPWKWRL